MVVQIDTGKMCMTHSERNITSTRLELLMDDDQSKGIWFMGRSSLGLVFKEFLLRTKDERTEITKYFRNITRGEDSPSKDFFGYQINIIVFWSRFILSRVLTNMFLVLIMVWESVFRCNERTSSRKWDLGESGTKKRIYRMDRRVWVRWKRQGKMSINSALKTEAVLRTH